MPIIVDIFATAALVGLVCALIWRTIPHSAGSKYYVWFKHAILSNCRDYFKKSTHVIRYLKSAYLGVFILIIGIVAATVLTLLFTQSGLYDALVGIIWGATKTETTQTYTTNIIEFMKTAVFTLGALGGAYGLVLAARRQNVLERQTQQGQDQLFNDRLGRGVELLGHKDMAVRVAGIKVLEDLALTSEKRNIIRSIFDSFIQTNAGREIDYEASLIFPNEVTMIENRLDVFASVKAFIRIDQDINEFSHLNNLNLDNCDFTSLDYKKNIIHAFSCNLKNTTFAGLNLSDADFQFCHLSYAKFSLTDLTNSKFTFTNLSYARFIYSNLDGCNFSDVDCTSALFINTKNMTKDHLSQIFYEEGKPPIVPDHVKIPSNRSYQWIIVDGERQRKFLKDKGTSLSDILNVIPY